MSPSQLYSELIEDSSVREQVFKIVGIERKEESSDGSSGYGSSESQEYESQSYESES
jgi:hypothetical protein